MISQFLPWDLMGRFRGSLCASAKENPGHPGNERLVTWQSSHKIHAGGEGWDQLWPGLSLEELGHTRVGAHFQACALNEDQDDLVANLAHLGGGAVTSSKGQFQSPVNGFHLCLLLRFKTNCCCPSSFLLFPQGSGAGSSLRLLTPISPGGCAISTCRNPSSRSKPVGWNPFH